MMCDCEGPLGGCNSFSILAAIKPQQRNTGDGGEINPPMALSTHGYLIPMASSKSVGKGMLNGIVDIFRLHKYVMGA